MPEQRYPFSVGNGLLPSPNGEFASPLVLGFSFTFTSPGDLAKLIDLSSDEMQRLQIVQSVYIDNGSNANALTLNILITGQYLTVPPYTQGYFPVLVHSGADILVTSDGSGSAAVSLINMPMPAVSWNVQSSAGGGLNTGSYTDYSGTITSGGTAQTVIAANTSRKGLLIHNDISSPETIYINFGAAATVGSGSASDSISLLPGGTLWLTGDALTTEYVSIISATTGTPFTAKELV